jgi:glycosyltransferase involved in cell wall biosynthesis/ADP-heptose:LPS heptosyltransferase
VKKLILKNSLSPGDIVMLTAAVRDLHGCYPGRFATDVRTPYPELWENNPYITPLADNAPDVQVIDCHYPLINQSNQTPHHFIHAFIHFLNEKLNLSIKPTKFRGDIYISDEEKEWASQVYELTGEDTPFWIIVAGGKRDYTVKWWARERYQEVVDHFRGKIQFVQVGSQGHYHSPVKGTIDLIGKTNLRQLVRLVYHAQGVLCPVTSLMHLAAAVEVKRDSPKNRPCVVVAGGREPAQWEAYPHHQFIHTNGSLKCCADGGCWKARTLPLGDGDIKDRPENLCVNVVGALPRCMDMITARDVIERIELYFQGGALNYLTPHQDETARIAINQSESASWKKQELESNFYESKAEQFIESIPSFPKKKFRGKGIVICAGGLTYFTNAWVCINMLRRAGCNLPIQLWHMDKRELDDRMKALVKPLGVECVDALEVAKRYRVRSLNGWSVKPYAMIHSPFKEVLYLDADNVSLVNPEYLFEAADYKENGAVFWPDVGRLSSDRSIWRICGIPYRDEPEFESGQMLIDKERTWKPLSLAMWYNENSDFYYQHIYGDKDTYHMAFRKLNAPYAMPATPPLKLDGAMCQHDFEGGRIFQHRNLDKWSLAIRPKRIKGFRFHKVCDQFVKSLGKLWDGKIEGTEIEPETKEERALIKEITSHRYDLHVVSSRHQVTFARDGRIDSTLRDEAWSWKIHLRNDGTHLEIYSQAHLIGELVRIKKGIWKNSNGECLILPLHNRIKGCVWLRASINSYTGYGLHAIQIISDFLRNGYEGKILPIGFDEAFNPVPPHIRECIVSNNNGDWELLLHAPNIKTTLGKKTVYFTMWETTGLPQNGAKYLNQSECVIVPCQWNVEQLLAGGVKKPIYQVPLGINTKLFKYSPLRLTGPCIFGTAGRMAVGGIRKGFEKVIPAFLDAFPSESDVYLYVKAFPDCEIPYVNDPRIIVIQKYLTDQEMAKWYRSITCFVSGARGEGWGLMQHQALATGRPLISIEYGGVREFFNKDVGYPVDYTLVSAENVYRDCGLWAELSHQSLVERMRQVYQDREEAAALGKRGAKEVSTLSWQSSNLKLLEILTQVGMFS